MTRINTNVSSINAQKTLARSNATLQESLTRLSTGLRINSGKDDPAGLIASEVLRSDIVSVERAITNSERANQMIATADSALGQVSSLLNDIRGLVSEAANTGAMSAEQIAANQLQIDSSLEAIDRIAQTTQFQGKRLLDGNLDFLTEGVDSAELQDIQIDQANFGSLSQIDVDVDVVTQATKGTLNYGFGAVSDDVVLEVGGQNGFEAFTFAAGSTIEEMAASINLVSDALGVTAEVERAAQTGAVTVSSFGTDNDITITAKSAGHDAGDIRVKYTKGAAGIEADYGFAAVAGDALDATYTAAVGNDPAKLDVTLETEAWRRASFVKDPANPSNAFAIVAKQAGDAYNGIDVEFTVGAGAGAAVATFNGSKLTIQIDTGVTTAATVVTAINAATNPLVSSVFKATLLYEGDGAGGGAITDNAALDGEFTNGYDGGAVKSTANEVVAEINNASELSSTYVTAALSGTDNGYGTVSDFQEFGFYGSAEANNYLQFLGQTDTRNIRFEANTAGSGLTVDFTSDPQVKAYSKAVVQQTAANASFEIEARNKGGEYDDVTIEIVDNGVVGTAQDYVSYDEKAKKLTFSVGIGDTTAQNIVDMVNSANSPVSDVFRARAYSTSTLAGLVNTVAAAAEVQTSGGIASEGAVVVKLATDANGLVTTTANDLISFFNTDHTATDATLQANLEALGVSMANIGGSNGSGLLAPTTSDIAFATSGTELNDYQASGATKAANGVNARLVVTAVQPGAEYDGVQIVFEDTATAAAETFAYDSNTKTLTIGVQSGVSTVDNITASWTAYTGEYKSLFTMSDSSALSGGGDGSAAVVIYDEGVLSGGVQDDGEVQGAALLGNEDSAAIGLNFNATQYGSEAFVSVKTLNGASFALTDAAGDSAERATGTDVNARINGIQALGKGLTATINTSALDMTFSVNANMTDNSTTGFSIVGGGATFQLGPSVVSNQQARLGISSVNTTKLGGVAGRLYELRSGNAASLANDTIAAAAIVEETITEVVTLRGRLGAFQSTTLDSNIASLEDTLENLTAAESDIRDADFAEESAKLTRAQILVQSGTSVLAMANQNPQSVLSLLQ